MDSLRADMSFGWRQLWKRKVITLAAVVSLGLAMGSCVAILDCKTRSRFPSFGISIPLPGMFAPELVTRHLGLGTNGASPWSARTL